MTARAARLTMVLAATAKPWPHMLLSSSAASRTRLAAPQALRRRKT
jgi:hypothetical protein